jgi:hypothetical protein
MISVQLVIGMPNGVRAFSVVRSLDVVLQEQVRYLVAGVAALPLGRVVMMIEAGRRSSASEITDVVLLASSAHTN